MGSYVQGLKTQVRQGPPAPVVGKLPEPDSDQWAGTSLWLHGGLGAGERCLYCAGHLLRRAFGF